MEGERGDRKKRERDPRPAAPGGGERRGRDKRKGGDRSYHQKREEPKRIQPEKPAFVPETSPFSAETEPGLHKAHLVAQKILHDARPEIPVRIEPPAGASEAEIKRYAREQKEADFDRAEDLKLTAAYEYAASLRPPELRAKEARSHAFSQILEAMLLTGGTKLFGEKSTVLPAQFSDRKDATDVVVDLGKGVALAIDAATEQDLDGYPNSNGVIEKGIDEKMMRSYQNVASDFGIMTRAKYAGNAHEVREIKNMPRVVLGLSQETIGRLAPLWAANPRDFDPTTHDAFRQLKRSAAKQLLSQIELAEEEERRTKSAKKHSEAKTIRRVLAAFNEKVDGRGAPPATFDPVAARIDAVVTNRNKRQEIIARAKRAQAELHQGFAAVAADRPKTEAGETYSKVDVPETAPLTPLETAAWQKHLHDVVEKGKRDEVQKALDEFLAKDPASKPVFPKEYLSAVAAGVPVRLFKRLYESIHGPITPVVAGTTPREPAPPAPIPAPAAEPAPGEPAPAELHPEPLPMPAAPLAAHLAALQTQGGKFETRGSRWASRFKNGFLHSLSALFAYGSAYVAKLALIGLGVSSLSVLIGSALVGYGAFYGAYKFMKHKKWHDNVWEREREMGVARVETLRESHPTLYARLVASKGTPNDLYEKEVVKWQKRGVWGGRVVAGLAGLGVAGLNAHYQTGGKIWSVFGDILYRGETLSGALTKVASIYGVPNNGAPGGSLGAPAAGAIATTMSGNGGTSAPTPRNAGFTGLTTSPDQFTNPGTTNRRRGIQFVQDPTVRDPWDPRFRHDPANPWGSWQRRSIPAQFTPSSLQGAPLSAHEIAMARQTPGGFMGLRAQMHANVPMIQTQGGGYWNSSTYGSLQHSLGFPRRW